MVSGSMLLTLLVQLVVGGLIFWVLYWFMGQIALPEPFNKVAIVVLALAAVVFLIRILMAVGGLSLSS